MSISRVVIKTREGSNGLRSSVEIDGVLVNHLRAFRILHIPGELPSLLMEIFPTEIEISEDKAEVETICFCPECKKAMQGSREGGALEDIISDPPWPFHKPTE